MLFLYSFKRVKLYSVLHSNVTTDFLRTHFTTQP